MSVQFNNSEVINISGLEKIYIGANQVYPTPYVTFDSDEPRTITPSYTNNGITLQYSLDTEIWIDIASKGVTPEAKTIYMRGQATGTKSLFMIGAQINKWIFSGEETNKLRVTGNLNFLLCDTLGDTVAPTTLGSNCYQGMFQDCTSLINAPELSATLMAEFCYGGMFAGCTSLVTAPELPATTLADGCYGYMFNGCTSLVNAPALPATTLANYCYNGMFIGCTSLVNAPELPATTLGSNCYQSIFQDCTSLVTATELPATTLADYCYAYMFYNCTSLVNAPELPATLEDGCYQCMFRGCISLVNTPELPATTLTTGCYGSMFMGCTSLTIAPELPATTLADRCYNNMFQNCTSLVTVKIHATTNLTATNALTSMLYGVKNTGTLTCKAALTTSYLPTPAGWTRVNF